MKLTKPMNLEDSICKHIAVSRFAMTDDVFGVEVELEGKCLLTSSEVITGYWAAHNDGSLRKLVPGSQAIEYIFNKPLDLQRTERAIEALFNFLNNPPVTVFDSYRTSIHVHVNYSQNPFRVVYNAMVLSIILDELLVSQNGQHRVGNNFCLRAKDAMGQTISLIDSIQMTGTLFNIQPNERYSSINFASLLKFGTIEYRSLECTTHEGRVLHWIKTLLQIKNSAKLFKNPAEIIRQFSYLDPEAFLRQILGPFAGKYLQVSGYENMLHNGMRIAQDLAFCSEWNEVKP